MIFAKKEIEQNTSSDRELINWIRLIRSENVGPKTFYQLLEIYGSAADAIEAIPDIAMRVGNKRPITICDYDVAEREIENSQKIGAEIITKYNPAYPKRLAQIDDAPPVLTVLGNKSLLAQNNVAIVGSRNASVNGCRIASEIAKDLGDNGFVVVSGLARGIDTSAHKGSLSSGTVAVIAGGVDHIYPKENECLYNAIANEGVIIAESPCGAVPRSESFPARNRIISGLSYGTLVVEATVKSGSLITANYALEHGREVMAVPGFPMDPRASGPNKLIKEGATLVESADDVIEVIGYNRSKKIERLPENKSTNISLPQDNELNEIRSLILQKLSTTPIVIDDLVLEIDIEARKLLSALLELEIAGRVVRHPGNKVALSGK